MAMSTPGSSKSISELQEPSEEEVYEVEKLMGHRMSLKYKSTVEYLIKWKDYDEVYNSWENENNIFSKGLVLEYWRSQPYTLQQFRDGSYREILQQPQQQQQKQQTIPQLIKAQPITLSTTPTLSPSPSPQSQKITTMSNAKKRPSPSTVMLDIEKRQKIANIRNAQITAEPPKGLKWEDISSISNVFHCGKSTYFAEVRWNRPDTVSFIPTRIIRKHNPLKLIYFYEGYLDFYVSPSQYATED